MQDFLKALWREQEQLQDLRTRFGLDDRVFAELREVRGSRARCT